MKHSIKVLCLSVPAVLLWTSILLATPYITPEEWEEVKGKIPVRLSFPPVSPFEIEERLSRLTDETYSYLFEYIQICDFLVEWQVSDTTSPNYGGMIEGETGDLTTIIQTDNTQEVKDGTRIFKPFRSR